MTVFETVFLCLTIPLVYVFAYLAGKCDFPQRGLLDDAGTCEETGGGDQR